ncbi:MAG: hypothetical protein WAR22_13720 [Desulfomonilia bacterium]|jgi:hypothetical protein
MKVNPEISSVINLVKREVGFQERAGEKVEAHSRMEDVISVENRAASRPGAQNVEEAGELLSQVMNNIESAAPSVHNLDQYRISQLFS